MAAPSSVMEIDPSVWEDRLDELFAQVMGPFFGRRELRLRGRVICQAC